MIIGYCWTQKNLADSTTTPLICHLKSRNITVHRYPIQRGPSFGHPNPENFQYIRRLIDQYDSQLIYFAWKVTKNNDIIAREQCHFDRLETMNQTVQLVDTLKKILRERKVTYAEIADHLELSEANVKRMFSKRHFTLARLESVCTLINIDLGFLMNRMQEESKLIDSMSLEAETELINNIKLLMIAQLLINRWTLEEIVSTYTFDDCEVTRLLAQLDRLGVIELLPGNRARVLVSRHFKWINNGPVQKYFKKHVAAEFFDCDFDLNSGELLIFVYGMLSRASNAQIQNSIRRLAREFDELCKEDSKQPLKDIYGTGVVMAMRPWELSSFNQFRREPNNKRF